MLEQFLSNDSFDLFDVSLPFLLLLCNLSLDIVIDIGVQISEAQVLQFILNPVDPEPISQGGIYIEGLLGNGFLFIRKLVLQSPHIVDSIRQFH